MRPDSSRSTARPDEPSPEASEVEGRAPWQPPELEELPPLTEVVLGSPIEGGGPIGGDPFRP
jgi:hypothetical protein